MAVNALDQEDQIQWAPESPREARLVFWLRALVSTGTLVCGSLAVSAFALLPKAEKIFHDLLGDPGKLPAVTLFILNLARSHSGGLGLLAMIFLLALITPWLARRLDVLLFVPMVINCVLLACFVASLIAILFPVAQVIHALGAP